MTGELEFKVSEEWSEHKRNNPWLAFVPEFAEGKDGETYLRPAGRKLVYRLAGHGKNQYYSCVGCGSEVQSVLVAHPIHDGPFPLSGSGRCSYEQVPFCPKCEEKPSSHGSFIRVEFKF